MRRDDALDYYKPHFSKLVGCLLNRCLLQRHQPETIGQLVIRAWLAALVAVLGYLKKDWPFISIRLIALQTQNRACSEFNHISLKAPARICAYLNVSREKAKLQSM